jgi:hypothetical protein
MATSTKTKRKKVECRETCVVIVGARPPEYRKVIVRDRHSGMLAEVSLAPSEAPPLDEGDEGRSYVFKRGELVWDDHEAVLEAPGCFVPLDDD